MKFEWDESKREINIAKHGIDFNQIEEVSGSLCTQLKMTDLTMARSDILRWAFWTVG